MPSAGHEKGRTLARPAAPAAVPASRKLTIHRTAAGFLAMACLRRGSPMIKERSSAGLAQLVEHLICNQGATGSSPVAGTGRQRRHQKAGSWTSAGVSRQPSGRRKAFSGAHSVCRHSNLHRRSRVGKCPCGPERIVPAVSMVPDRESIDRREKCTLGKTEMIRGGATRLGGSTTAAPAISKRLADWS